MLAQRTLTRGAARFGAQLRSPAQRRLNTTWAKDRQHTKDHAAGTTDLWKKIAIACVPAIALAGANAYKLWNEHWEHWSHLPPLEERTEYPYQNIRSKNFTWGDGDKTLFWNEGVNYHDHDKVK
ncbi:related to cytochrome-c oxidase chain VIa precursor [Cephalotrichum gorgonifer]|uniref:Cytochrome c oxidase subunit n=1 Tax=Cephalotrichum gorgonifer TaxID=2041049 RepID=A0AAE8N065_9PEZI|nr:related to cytochrome-c oxidase chain VIa precursor [Cephalotrichum gorgonifer]